MMKRTLALALIVGLLCLGALAQAQDQPTPTPLPEEPPPTCVSFQNAARDSRTSYYMGEGVAYLGNSQLSQAKNSFACIVRVVDPSYVPGWMGRARVNTRMADYERAFADLNRAVQLAPDLAAAYNDRGYIFMQWRDYPRAEADFERALSIDASYAPAYSNLAVAYLVQEKYDDAIALLEQQIDDTRIDNVLAQMRAPDYNPNNPIPFSSVDARLYALLGIVYERQALTQFRDYLELFNRSGRFADDRIAQVSGALESRFTFELRLDDGSWLLLSSYPADSGA